MKIDGILNKMDCTFYFILKEKDKTITLKEEVQKRICKKLEPVVDVHFYGMRSGPELRSTLSMKNEFSGTIPEQVNIVFIDKDNDKISLLSTLQRDMFFERVMECVEDLDTVDVIETIIKETPDQQ